MNVGKIGAGGALVSLGSYAAGLTYGMGLVFLGVTVVIFGATLIGWEELKSRKE